ncbi:hypothetical protein DY000_02041493 [Brassica cretica]|uniref:Uncharacterized protein n=1 Tax=Brassica cretica TaxID=69181 RepID=A0ABQ7B4A6_BRACR|nr:hypothetical protein DY000_02041493 [Brassica cretica]
MRGDTWASTCPGACSLAMPEDTSTSTCPSACLVFMHRDTRASHVSSHAQIAGIATSGASMCQAAWNCFMHVYTSFLCLYSAG